MTKLILSALVAASLGVLSAHAKTMRIPNEESAIASIDIPDSWDPEEITNGVAGTSEDEAVYLAVVAVGNEKGMDAQIEDTFEMLQEHDVTLDQASKKENKFKINGLDAEEMLFQARAADGDAAVTITFVPMKDKVVVLTYWVAMEDEKKHKDEVGKIVKSVKPAA